MTAYYLQVDHTRYPAGVFRCFPHTLQAVTGLVPQIMPRPLSPTSFQFLTNISIIRSYVVEDFEYFKIIEPEIVK
jgi:hypothetical protein